MQYGVIDIGSNSIRLSIYECEGSEITQLINKREMAGLAGYVKKDGMLAEAGIRCGRDLSLIGFDNISLAAAIDPPLSSVRVYHDALGATAVRRLSELITTPSQMHTHIAVGTSLELRESVL